VFKNKLLNISIIIFITIALLGGVSFILYQYIFPQKSDIEVDKKLIEVTVDIPKISTNLGDSSVIVLELTLTIQTDNDELTLEEANTKIYKIKDEIIVFLKNYSMKSFSSVEEINQFKKDLTVRINEIIESGKVVSIDITQLFYQ